MHLTVEKGSTFSALRSHDFRLFWASSVISNLGLWLQLFGQGYLVVQLALREGAPHLVPFYAGLVGLSQAIPGLALGLFGGVAADHYDRKRVLVITQLCLSALMGTLAALTISGRVNIVEVLGISALVSTANAFDNPTRSSWIPSLVPRERLVSAVGLNSASVAGTQVLGPVLGGLLYVPLGMGGLFLVNALSYLAVAGAQLCIPSCAIAGDLHQPPRPLRSIVEGVRYIVHDPVTLWVFVLCAMSQFLVRPYTQLLPSYAEGTLHVGALQLSWLLAASGGGGFVGALVTASLSSLERRGRFLIIAGVASGMGLVLLSTQRVLAGAIGSMAIVALTAALFQGAVNTTLQVRSPDDLRGRVLSVLMMLPLGIMPLGIAALGFVGSATGVAVSMGLGGFTFGLLMVITLPLGSDLWRAVDHRDQRGTVENTRRQ